MTDIYYWPKTIMRMTMTLMLMMIMSMTMLTILMTKELMIMIIRVRIMMVTYFCKMVMHPMLMLVQTFSETRRNVDPSRRARS